MHNHDPTVLVEKCLVLLNLLCLMLMHLHTTRCSCPTTRLGLFHKLTVPLVVMFSLDLFGDETWTWFSQIRGKNIFRFKMLIENSGWGHNMRCLGLYRMSSIHLSGHSYIIHFISVTLKCAHVRVVKHKSAVTCIKSKTYHFTYGARYMASSSIKPHAYFLICKPSIIIYTIFSQ